MNFKIQPDACGLCGTCRESQVIEFIDGRKSITCHSRGRDPLVINRLVSKCNDYDDKNQASKYEMMKIAWTVKADKKGNHAGFVPPKKLEDDF